MSTALQDRAQRDSLQDSAKSIFDNYDALIAQLQDPLPPPEDKEWGARRVLSHVIGSWNRVPLMAGFYLSDSEATVPIVTNDDFWMEEFASAPVSAFRAAHEAAYEGNAAFLRTLDDEQLDGMLPTTFGEMSLGDLLMALYESHLGDHVNQLESVVT